MKIAPLAVLQVNRAKVRQAGRLCYTKFELKALGETPQRCPEGVQSMRGENASTCRCGLRCISDWAITMLKRQLHAHRRPGSKVPLSIHSVKYPPTHEQKCREVPCVLSRQNCARLQHNPY